MCGVVDWWRIWEASYVDYAAELDLENKQKRRSLQKGLQLTLTGEDRWLGADFVLGIE